MKDYKRIILVAVFALFSIGVMAQTQADAINTYNEARDLATSKDYSAAISKYEEAISVAGALGADGDDIKQRAEKAIPKLYYQKAVESFRNFQSTKTMASLDASIKEFKDSQKNGTDYNDTDVYNRSTNVLAQLYYQKATMYFQMEEFENADAALNDALSTNSNYAKAYYQKGLVYKKLSPEDTDGITNWFDRAINVAMTVNDSEVERQATEAAHAELLYRGSKLVEQGKFADGTEVLKRSLSYNAESSDSYYRLSEAANKAGKRDDAIKYATEALKYEQGGSTDKAKIYFELGVAYQAKDSKGPACEALKNASYGSFKAPAEHKIEFELKCESASPSDN